MFKNKSKIKQAQKERRHLRTRAKIFGTATRPRLSVTKSLLYVYLQLIDDEKGKTLLSLHSKTLGKKGTKTELAYQAGASLAKSAIAKGFTTCVFDRGSSIYHGRIKAVAEGLRQGGMKF